MLIVKEKKCAHRINRTKRNLEIDPCKREI